MAQRMRREGPAYGGATPAAAQTQTVFVRMLPAQLDTGPCDAGEEPSAAALLATRINV